MPDTVRIKRTTGNTPPPSLAFGELAFSEGNSVLYIGKSDQSILSIPLADLGQPSENLITRLEALEQAVFGNTTQPVINFPDFSSISGIQLNGAATQSGNVLLLTPDEPEVAGSAFYSTPIPVSTQLTFQCRFQFQITGNTQGADGFTFCLQNSVAGYLALGGSGTNLGYGPSITSSLAVEFDTFQGVLDSTDNEISILRDGDMESLASVSSGLPNLSSGEITSVWIDYIEGVLQIFIGNQPEQPITPVLTHQVNLFSIVGSQFYAGFTAGTGGSTNAHQIRSWTLQLLE